MTAERIAKIRRLRLEINLLERKRRGLIDSLSKALTKCDHTYVDHTSAMENIGLNDWCKICKRLIGDNNEDNT